MFCKIKKKFDFSSLIFDSRKILAASLNNSLRVSKETSEVSTIDRFHCHATKK